MKQLTPPINHADHILGKTSVQIELVEYGDYECFYCGLVHPIIKRILRQFSGSIKFVFRNFPLRKIHPNAFLGAVATEASGLQGKFWDMHDIIFENQKNLNIKNIFLFANWLDLDITHFKNDIRRTALIDKVENDFESGTGSGVKRTPTFFVNGHIYNGDMNPDQLFQYLKTKQKEVPLL
jgi:protein-disulfide isomerase